MVESQEANHVHQLAQKALQANREHQRALNTYIEKLEAELQMVEGLIDAANIEMEDDSDLDVPGFVLVPGAVRAASAIPSSELESPDSPFHGDALRRDRYKSLTDCHPMKARELDALAEAVRTENYRKMAFDAQIMGLPTSHDMSERSPKSLERNCEGLDWDRIAEKVSRASMTTRTARECEIRWLGDRHPDFNHDPWNEEEIFRLKSLVAGCRNGSPDWSDIAQKLGTNRTPLDCMRQGITRKNHAWTPTSDERLIKAVHMFGHNWSLVSRYVSEDATPVQCSTRYQRSLDPSVKRVNWTLEEDARLRIAAAAYGQSWVDVAAAMPGRTNDQCRDRWNEQVNPNLNRSPWSPEEDKALLDVVRENENAAWKEISKLLGTGRTDTMCRNRYLTLQRGLKFPSLKFKATRHPSLDSEATTTPESSCTPSDAHSLSPGPLPPGSPLRQEVYTQNEGSPLTFLEPVVSSDPTINQWFTPGSARPLMPPGSASNTPKRLSTPSSSISSSSKGGKKRQKRLRSDSVERVPKKRRKTARPKQAGMEGQLLITFGPALTADSMVSTPTTPSIDSRETTTDQIPAHFVDIDQAERSSSLGTYIT
ncbi:hypothetical protein M404DRAFT_994019 [Pisolithus tinctorius Marx 270]|uniref:Uncharacterized protein n=1 Tax=Pisolithus tinctorius Marx 270 TaxID=870435 RepID=A0A0C3JV89_PISTI|nr:hypothetical protein M404DRAFT_994019 [Pisolithus tinctorius Marx 270]